MHAVFALENRAPAEAIRLRLTPPVSSSAIRTMLARLERKGYLRHAREGKKYLYSATDSKNLVNRAELRRFVSAYFAGSFGRLVTSLLKRESWTDAELDALSAEIQAARRRRK